MYCVTHGTIHTLCCTCLYHLLLLTWVTQIFKNYCFFFLPIKMKVTHWVSQKSTHESVEGGFDMTYTYSDSSIGRILPSNETVHMLNSLLLALAFESLWSQLMQCLVELFKCDDTSGLCPGFKKKGTNPVIAIFSFLSVIVL